MSLASTVRRAARVAVVASFLLSCSSEKTTPTSSSSSGGTAPAKPDANKLFAASVKNVVVEVDYGPGAEPYAGNLKNFGPVWNLFRGNALAIFDGKKTVSYPDALSKMEKLDDLAAKSYSSKELLAVAAAHRSEASSADTAAFYILFVDGHWVDDAGAEQKDVTGVSIGDSGVVAIFKPAVNAAGGASPELVEQLVLIHFFGHAVGFVDNGVTVADSNKAHIDTADGRHCTNTKCAMNAAVESPSGAASYAKTLIRGPEAVLLGQECLSDARLLETKLLGN